MKEVKKRIVIEDEDKQEIRRIEVVKSVKEMGRKIEEEKHE